MQRKEVLAHTCLPTFLPNTEPGELHRWAVVSGWRVFAGEVSLCAYIAQQSALASSVY